MIHIEDINVRSTLMRCGVGLEKESLRITADGFMAGTPHPFPDDPEIVTDFCENQVEINLPAAETPEDAVGLLQEYTDKISERLRLLPEPEYLWPFSNPPYLRGEEDVPIAAGKRSRKTSYREYLSRRYGRYMMTFSGIHYNYSFSNELLMSDLLAARKAGEVGDITPREYRDRFYLHLAKRALQYNWLIVAITAASPLVDSSYVDSGMTGYDVFNGMGSTRCSAVGYWNCFAPEIDYDSIEAYADSIQKYIEQGLIRNPAELFFPVRIKPIGKYDIESFKKKGIGRIELRMIDLNPLSPSGIDLRDAQFLQLFLIWLASLPEIRFDMPAQIKAVHNTKDAAYYYLEKMKIQDSDGEVTDISTAALRALAQMRSFYWKVWEWEDLGKIEGLIRYQEMKFRHPENRYAWKIRNMFGGGVVKKGLEYIR